MFTLSIANRKGGSGKTTTSVNIAAQLSIDHPDKRILLIDLDTQNHAKLGLGKASNKTSLGIHTIFGNGRCPTSGMIHKTRWKNLWYIPADEEAMENNTGNGFHRLKYFLSSEQIKQNFDVAILDTPPSHGAFLINAIIASDAVLITFVPQKLDKTGVEHMVKLINRHAGKHCKLAFLPTMTKARIRHHNHTLASVVKKFGTANLLKGIRSGIQLAEAFESGQPIQYYAPKSRGAFDYHMLLNELKLIWPKMLADLEGNSLTDKKPNQETNQKNIKNTYINNLTKTSDKHSTFNFQKYKSAHTLQ